MIFALLTSLAFGSEIDSCVEEGYRVTAERGLTERLARVPGALFHRKQSTYNGLLKAGHIYSVFVCGGYTAVDIDLAVTDWNGTVIIHDKEISRNPIIVVQPLITGRYTFDVIMYDSEYHTANYQFVIVGK